MFQNGDPSDQNADGTSDENPLTLPDGYTGTTPGDVYAVPSPDPTSAVTFKSAAYTGGTNTGGYILSPPFNQNTLPMIVPGPQVASTTVVGTSGQVVSGVIGSQNVLSNDSTSEYQVTFDRPIQTSTFTPSQVLSIMGPTGSITAPQTFSPSAVNQSIPAATPAGPGTLSSTVTISSGGTLTSRGSPSRSASPPRRAPGSPGS